MYTYCNIHFFFIVDFCRSFRPRLLLLFFCSRRKTMPKSKASSSFLRAKNKTGNADFKRKKKKMRKIGYRSGDTHINIRSRSLQMTEQSIVSEKGAIVSSRNLTLAEVLRQCDHHNYKSRVAALEGLEDILGTHNEIILPSLQDVINSTLALMMDLEVSNAANQILCITRVYDILICACSISKIKFPLSYLRLFIMNFELCIFIFFFLIFFRLQCEPSSIHSCHFYWILSSKRVSCYLLS